MTLVATRTDWFQPCAMLLSDIETELKSFGLKLLPFTLSGSPSKCWLHACRTCVLATFRLGLRGRLVAGNAQHNSSTEIGLFMIPVCRKYKLFVLYLILKKLSIGERDGIKYFEQKKFKD